MKSKVLFNSCGILIKKYFCGKDVNNVIYSDSIEIIGDVEVTKDPRIVRKIRSDRFLCKSPLGFFYYKTKPNDVIKRTNKGLRKTWNVYCGSENEMYEISYYTQYNDTNISHETRPWDLIGNGLSDHFINDLEKIMKGIRDIVDANKFQKREADIFRIDAFVELFGSKDGVKTQTNDGKILSHGFDLKYSFRKDKEK